MYGITHNSSVNITERCHWHLIKSNGSRPRSFLWKAKEHNLHDIDYFLDIVYHHREGGVLTTTPQINIITVPKLYLILSKLLGITFEWGIDEHLIL